MSLSNLREKGLKNIKTLSLSSSHLNQSLTHLIQISDFWSAPEHGQGLAITQHKRRIAAGGVQDPLNELVLGQQHLVFQENARESRSTNERSGGHY